MKCQYLLFFTIILITHSYCEVKFVFEFLRNGITSPNKLDKDNTDIFKEKWIKPNQLTALGMKKQYIIGAKLKRHYINKLKFLKEEFNNDDIKIFSVDKSSNILTTYSQLLGMFPAQKTRKLDQYSIKSAMSNYDLYNSDQIYSDLEYSPLPLQTQLFPIKTFPPDNNYFGLSNEKNCKGVGDFIALNKEKPEVQKFLSNFSTKYYSQFKEPLNLPEGFFLEYSNLNRFCTDYLAGINDQRQFISIKSLIDTKKVNYEILKQDCRDQTTMDIFTVRLGDSSKQVLRIAITNIINQLISQLDNVLIGDNTGKPYDKFIIFNGDINDVASFMDYLKLTLNIVVFYPFFSSTILIELSKNKINNSTNSISNNSTTLATNNYTEEDYSINIYFNEKTLATMRYSEFKQKVLMYTVDSKTVDDFCGFTDLYGLYFKIAAGFLFVFGIGFGVWIICLIKKMRKLENPQDENENKEGERALKKSLVNNEELNQ